MSQMAGSLKRVAEEISRQMGEGFDVNGFALAHGRPDRQAAGKGRD